jgi:CheY-like chemotaxis protein
MRKVSENQQARLRVLIVDDSVKVRQDLALLLSTFPRLELVGEAQDGLEALSAIERLDPDLIILDIRMPKMNGFEVLKALEQDRRKRIVIAISALADESCKEKCLQLGAHNFFDKVTEFGKFVERLKTL